MKALFEKRLTLDNLFGPGLSGPNECAKYRFDSLAENRRVESDLPKELRSFFIAKLEALKQFLGEQSTDRPVSIFNISLKGEDGGRLFGYRPGRFRFRIRMNTSLRLVMSGYLRDLRESIRQTEEELEILVIEAAEADFADANVREKFLHCDGWVIQHIESRGRSLLFAFRRLVSFALRDLVAELLSPHVLTCGGCAGAFILRI